jgi:ribosomal protein S12 methylthiotransferase accessory factor YcaO
MSEPETLTELLNEGQTITVSREAFTETIKQLLTQLPDMLAESAENMPVYARAAMPVVRMLLASEDMQNMLSGDSIIDFIWSALESCQNE